jgi:hypothetical protein
LRRGGHFPYNTGHRSADCFAPRSVFFRRGPSRGLFPPNIAGGDNDFYAARPGKDKQLEPGTSFRLEKRLKMLASALARRNKPKNISTYLIYGTLILLMGAGYLYFLKLKDEETVASLSKMRQTDPVHYLQEIRLLEGFDAYLKEYSEANGFNLLTRQVPDFLLGRWALFPERQRVGYHYIADDCSTFLGIEDGEMKAAGDIQAHYPARYRISGSTVEAEIGEGVIVPITLVSYGTDLHHIMVTLPGQPGPLYGYLCK